jgi:hypothetical protein
MVILDKVLFKISDFNEPGRNSLVDKRSLTSPTERIAVLNDIFLDESAILFEVLHDDFICSLDV